MAPRKGTKTLVKAVTPDPALQPAVVLRSRRNVGAQVPLNHKESPTSPFCCCFLSAVASSADTF